MAYMTKNKMIYASNKNTPGVGYGYGGFRDSVDSVGIPTGFSVGMVWVWALKFHPHGSPGNYACPWTCSSIDRPLVIILRVMCCGV